MQYLKNIIFLTLIIYKNLYLKKYNQNKELNFHQNNILNNTNIENYWQNF